MMSPYEIKKEICEIGRRIYMNGFVAANDGNISVKVSENEYYCTPTGVSKGFMTPDMIIKIDADGNKLEGKLNPSSEIKMHMRVYRERPDVNAVVHAHPPTATAYAVAGIPLDKYLLPEACLLYTSSVYKRQWSPRWNTAGRTARPPSPPVSWIESPEFCFAVRGAA